MTEDLLEELASLPSVTAPTVSSDGSRVAMYYDGTGRNELYVLDIESGSLSQWSDGDVPRTPMYPIFWAPDGDRLYFHNDETGDEQNDIFTITPDGTTECLVEVDGQIWIQDIGEDGDTILFTSTAAGQMNLYTYSVSADVTKRITDHDRAVMQGVLSPDCTRVAYGTNESDSFENVDVFIATVEGDDQQNLHIGETGAESYPIEWGPAGDRLLIEDTTEDLSRCGIYRFSSDDVRWLTTTGNHESATAFLGEGRVLAIRTEDAADIGVVHDLETEESETLQLPTGVTSFPHVGPPSLADDRILVSHSTPTRRSELLAYDLSTHESETVFEAEYGEIDPDMFRDAEFYTVTSNGVPDTPPHAVEHEPGTELEIECLLYDSGERPSPLIVNPLGGPPVHEKREFDLYTQFLLTRGYSVLQLNYRGSAGLGREFREELYDDWGGAEQGDIAIATEYTLAEHDWLDQERVIVLGGSYGGYSAYWQMVQYPDLWAAGVANVGMTDLLQLYENSMPHFRTELLEKYLGDPEDNAELYTERSPVTYVDNLDAPLLMIHGVNDPRVPVTQARVFRDALLEAGYEEGETGDFEYAELGEQGHGTGDIEQQIRAFRQVDDFLERRFGRPGLERSRTA